MALPIAQLGQPILRQATAEVPADEIASPRFQHFLQAMRTTLQEAQGAGLAGPQVFAHRRVFLAAVLPPPFMGGQPQVEVFINPHLSAASTQTEWNWEGCLSFPELLVLVERHQDVHIEYVNAQGEQRALDLAGFPARIVQHEYDHLEGILTIDRAPSTRYIIKASEIEAFQAGEKNNPLV